MSRLNTLLLGVCAVTLIGAGAPVAVAQSAACDAYARDYAAAHAQRAGLFATPQDRWQRAYDFAFKRCLAGGPGVATVEPAAGPVAGEAALAAGEVGLAPLTGPVAPGSIAVGSTLATSFAIAGAMAAGVAAPPVGFVAAAFAVPPLAGLVFRPWSGRTDGAALAVPAPAAAEPEVRRNFVGSFEVDEPSD